MKGNYNASIKIAKETYGYKTPENSGKIPKGTVINGVKYILIPVTHTAVCDFKGCQNQFIKYKLEKPEGKKYTIFPLYSNFGTHELCVICSNMENNKQFIPTKNEINRMLLIMDKNELMSDSDEGDECDECDECDDTMDQESEYEIGNLII
jgi:hypothetical protein